MAKSLKTHIIEIIYRNPSELLVYGKNARTHSNKQLSKLRKAIDEFGFTNPIIVDEEDIIIAGHGRQGAALLDPPMDNVPTIQLIGLTKAQKNQLRLSDNRLALDAGWNSDLLIECLMELKDEGADLSLTGFEDDELARYLQIENDGEVDEDDCPGLADKPFTQMGDIWILGDHVLMCGNSASLEDVERLMDKDKADMVFTDPPYNVEYKGRKDTKRNLGEIKNDSMPDMDFEEFCRAVFTNYHAVMKPLAAIYVCHPDSQTAPKVAFEKTFGELFKKSSTIIWVKNNLSAGFSDYRSKHEPILYGWREGDGKHFFIGDRSKSTIWEIGRDSQAKYVHPTQKPVALPLEAIQNSSKGYDIVLDLFGGSGSTLIAAHKSERKARIMELDPKYCDVIIKRWQTFSGMQAVHKETGATFEIIPDQTD